MPTCANSLNIIRNAMRDLGARIENRFNGIEYAHLPAGTVSYRCRFHGPDAGATLTHVYVAPRDGRRGFAVPVGKVATVDLALATRGDR